MSHWMFIVRNMPNNKNNNTEQFAEIFKALSNPNRLRIFLRLVTCCTPGTVSIVDPQNLHTTCIGDLGQDLGIVKSTVSHHIKELKRVDIIRTQRDGQKIECWINPEILKNLKDFFTF